MPGMLDGKVAIITGAGQGLGRSHALTFAKEGARVVVNDFAPSGKDNPADEVVDEIKAAGGEAIAHAGDECDSVLAHGVERIATRSSPRKVRRSVWLCHPERRRS